MSTQTSFIYTAKRPKHPRFQLRTSMMTLIHADNVVFHAECDIHTAVR